MLWRPKVIQTRKSAATQRIGLTTPFVALCILSDYPKWFYGAGNVLRLRDSCIVILYVSENITYVH